LRTLLTFVSVHIIAGIVWIVLIRFNDLDIIGNYPLDLILGGILVIILNIFLLKYFSNRIARFICAVLVLMAIRYCFLTDSQWRYAMTLVDDYQHNYTREWYCRLSDKDKSILESYTTHGFDDCTNIK
jgi:hypothetical protein